MKKLVVGKNVPEMRRRKNSAFPANR